MKHKHEFIPVEIAWLSYWGNLDEGKPPKPVHVILACECGTIKLVPARVRIKGSKEAVEYYKAMLK